MTRSAWFPTKTSTCMSQTPNPYLFKPGNGYRSVSLGLISQGELKSWLGFLALIRGPRLNAPSSPDWTLRRKGARGRSKPKPDPLFWVQGFLIADSWESQGNPPSTPAPVIRPSTCQSRQPAMTSWRWHGLGPLCLLCCLDVSEAGKHPSGYGISVSSGMLSLATAAQIDDGRGGGGNVFARVDSDKVSVFVDVFFFGTQKMKL